MVSTTLICVSHPCRLILSSWHILSFLMEDNQYLVDTCLVVASSWCWLLDLLDVSQRPLYTGTPSVLCIMAYWIYCHSDHIWSIVLVCEFLVLGWIFPQTNSYMVSEGGDFLITRYSTYCFITSARIWSAAEIRSVQAQIWHLHCVRNTEPVKFDYKYAYLGLYSTSR